jgi:hypothetical protein
VHRLHELRRALSHRHQGSAGLGAAASVGTLPNAPHIRLNLPVSASKTMTRRLPYPSATNSSFVLRVHERVGGLIQILRVGVALALPRLADLHDELAGLR